MVTDLVHLEAAYCGCNLGYKMSEVNEAIENWVGMQWRLYI